MLQISCLGTYSEIRLPMSNRFLKLMAEDIAKERMRVKHYIHIQQSTSKQLCFPKVGGDWVVAFAVYDRQDRDIFRRVLGHHHIALLMLMLVIMLAFYC